MAFMYNYLYSVAEDDWEASHFAEVGREEGNSLEVGALQHDDAILDAVPSVTTNHTPKLPTGAEGEEVNHNMLCTVRDFDCQVIIPAGLLHS